MKKRVGILFGGANSEHDVSVASARGIAANLDRRRFAPVLIGADRRGRWHRVREIDDLDAAPGGSLLPQLDDIDIAFPSFHGRFGEDGTVQGTLELAGVPYVGCGVLASALAMDKAMTSMVLAASGIRVPAGLALTAATRSSAAELTLPLFVKPNRGGSSVGASRVDAAGDLSPALDRALAEDRSALVQAVDDGDEVDVGVMQRVDGSLAIGPPLLVRRASVSTFFDYGAKYTPGGARFEVPACIGNATREAVEDAAVRAFRALDCEGLARIDFFVSDGSIVVNEVNTMPGMTAHSQFPRIWAAAGVDYPQLLTRLLERGAVARR